MLLGGYSVELSVDGSILKEYSEPADKRTTTTGVSYVLDQKTGQKIESDQTIYAAVDQMDKSYEVLYAIKKELFNAIQEEQHSATISFKAKILIDGQWDHSLRAINKPIKMKKDGFIGDKRKKTPLLFDLSKLKEIDEEKMVDNQDKFGYGAVSVYFFNSKDIEKNETTNESSPVPLAVLHLHYRPTQWLIERNILTEEKSSEIDDKAQETKGDKGDNETDKQDAQESKKVKLESKKKPKQPRKGKNKTTTETTTEMEEPAGDDLDISEWTGKLELDDELDTQVVEENKESKKRTRGKKVKKNVEEVKDEAEKRYNLRARK